MLFKNLVLFRWPASIREALESLPDAIVNHELREPGPLEFSTTGFVAPLGTGEPSPLTHRVGDCVLLTLGINDKLLPPSVVNDALGKKLAAIREREGRSPGGRERKRIKDEVLTDLLPKAFVRPSRISAYVDLDRGWFVIDTASRKQAEAFVSAVREVLGSFPALPVNAEQSARGLLTGWVGGEPLPDRWMLGDEVELRDPVEGGSKWSGRRAELDSDECREHLKAGKQAFRVGVEIDDRLGMVLCEDLVVRKLRFLESAVAQLEQTDRDSVQAELDAMFALMSGELRLLLEQLEHVFQFSARE